MSFLDKRTSYPLGVFTGLSPKNVARKAYWRFSPTPFAKAFRDLILCSESELVLGSRVSNPKAVFLNKINRWAAEGKTARARWWLKEAVHRTLFSAPHVSAEFACDMSKLDGKEYVKQLARTYNEAEFLQNVKARFYSFTIKKRKSDLSHVPTLEYHVALSGMDPELGRLLLTIVNLTINLREEFPAFLFRENQGPKINKYKEAVHAMDDYANGALRDIALTTGLVRFVHSEEEANPIIGPTGGRYRIAFDPLDGSSNIESFNSFGTIFSVFPAGGSPETLTGRDLLLAGMVIYGSVHGVIYSAGNGVHRFARYRKDGRLCFLQERSPMLIPDHAKVHGIGGAREEWSAEFRNFILELEQNHGSKVRYCGGFVPDFFQVLSHGGIFAYPSTTSSLDGKLRVAYECIPGAFLVEQAGGGSFDMTSGSILNIPLGDFDGRTPIIVGSRSLVADYARRHAIWKQL